MAASGRCDNATSSDAVDLATCRLRLTEDGWFIHTVVPDTIADPRAAIQAPVLRREFQQKRPSPVVAIAVVPHRHGGISQDAARMAADVLRSAVRSLLDSHDLRVELTVVRPGAGRDG
jgi:hypothetical protein